MNLLDRFVIHLCETRGNRVDLPQNTYKQGGQSSFTPQTGLMQWCQASLMRIYSHIAQAMSVHGHEGLQQWRNLVKSVFYI